MTEYIFRGTVAIKDTLFCVDADSLEEAKEKAAQGEYTWYDVCRGYTVDWWLDPSTGEENPFD